MNPQHKLDFSSTGVLYFKETESESNQFIQFILNSLFSA